MKKLMIAAAAAIAVGGAFAETTICDTIGSTTGGGCRVYDFKASVKLVDGVRKKEAGGICDPGGYAYYRVAAKRTLKGLFFECNSCNYTNNAAGVYGEPLLWGPDEGLNQNGPADWGHFVLSSSDSKYKVLSGTDFGTLGTDYTAWYEFKILNFFGSSVDKKAKKAEGLIDIDYMEYDKYGEFRLWSILCAGFGTQAGGMLKNLSGNLAGAVSAATWCGIPTVVFEPCLLHPSCYDYVFDAQGNFQGVTFDTGAYDPGTPCVVWSTLAGVDAVAQYSTDVVSGTWSMKYNASKSKLTSFNKLLEKTYGADTKDITKQKNYAAAARTAFPLLITKQI